MQGKEKEEAVEQMRGEEQDEGVEPKPAPPNKAKARQIQKHLSCKILQKPMLLAEQEKPSNLALRQKEPLRWSMTTTFDAFG